MSLAASRADRRVILTFHGIGSPARRVDGSESGVWLTRVQFDSALDAAAAREDVSITFDDGNRSDVEIALPALRRRGLTASFFVLAARLDAPGFLSAGELRELADAGMTVGSHGLEHTPWTKIASDQLERDLGLARSALERITARPVTEVSCPFGAYDRGVLRILRRAGYGRVYTSDGGPTRAGAWLQARNTIDSELRTLDRVLTDSDSIDRRLLGGAKRLVKRWR